MIIVIQGKIPAKSSSRRLIYARGRPMIISSQKSLDFEKLFHLQTLTVKRGVFGEDDRLQVHIDWYSDSYRQDIDSPAKILFDCLQKEEIIINDNKIDKYSIDRFIDKKNPRAEIKIEKFSLDISK